MARARRALPEVLQAVGLFAIELALYFLTSWPRATLTGGVILIVVGVLLELGRPRARAPRAGDR